MYNPITLLLQLICPVVKLGQKTSLPLRALVNFAMNFVINGAHTFNVRHSTHGMKLCTRADLQMASSKWSLQWLYRLIRLLVQNLTRVQFNSMTPELSPLWLATKIFIMLKILQSSSGRSHWIVSQPVFNYNFLIGQWTIGHVRKLILSNRLTVKQTRKITIQFVLQPWIYMFTHVLFTKQSVFMHRIQLHYSMQTSDHTNPRLKEIGLLYIICLHRLHYHSVCQIAW